LARPLASLLLTLVSWLLLTLILHGTLGLYASILSLMLAFAGAFTGFVSHDSTAPALHRHLSRSASILGCAALLLGSYLFLRTLTIP
jgi:hypothetical protein